jgi:hypothetical protein
MKYLIILMLLASSACAADIIWEIRDINTKQPIHNASIYMEANIDEKTDVNGLAYADLDGEYTYSVSKIGYFTQTYTATYTQDTSISYFMTPISDNAIIRIRFMDDNPIKHEICVFYEENGRFDGCYKENETIKLIINKGYVFAPTEGFFDNFNTIGAVYGWLNRMASWIIGLFILSAFIFVIVRKK